MYSMFTYGKLKMQALISKKVHILQKKYLYYVYATPGNENNNKICSVLTHCH